jgi:hypothetical protein
MSLNFQVERINIRHYACRRWRNVRAGVLAIDAPNGGLVHCLPAPGAFLRVLQTSWLAYPPLHADPGHVLFSVVHCLGCDCVQYDAEFVVEASVYKRPLPAKTKCAYMPFVIGRDFPPFAAPQLLLTCSRCQISMY